MPTNKDELTEAKGIGEKSAEQLRKGGITGLDQLAIARPEEVQSILEVSMAKAKEIISSAKDLALEKVIEIKTAQEVADDRKAKIKFIPTGSKEFDRILGGGIPTDMISTFTGAAATGKTQVCFSLMISCIKNLGRKVAYLETEPGTFVPERIVEMAKLKGITIDLSKDIYVIRASSINSPYQQFLAYEILAKKLASGVDIGLVCIDSFNSKFRQEFLGRERLTSRTQELARHIGMLETLTSRYNIAMVLTAQVGGIPDSGAQLGARMRFGMDKSPYGGEFFLHATGNLISMQMTRSQPPPGEWTATLVDSSYLPRASALFKISSKGIQDTNEV
ncbi:MAG: hypothetical protein E6L02_05070 [Thaumarchaeota archaeon]|nr:MAG: hypothetical protein E6L02_05070 [Nitrososphaerota archaeon]